LRYKSERLEKEIEEIKNNKTYKVVQEIDDWDSYFEDINTQLQETLKNYTKTLRDEKARNAQVKMENNTSVISDNYFYDTSEDSYKKAFDEYVEQYSKKNFSG